MNGNLQNKLQIMKKLLFTLFTLSIVLVQFGQGIKFDDNIYSKLEAWETNELGFSQTLPSSYSLRKHCPRPGRQKGGSCVGWANGYTAMSIIYNIKFDLDTTITKHTQLAFDPYFIYSLIYLEDENDCSEGTLCSMALDTLYHYGCKRKILPEITKCNSKIGNKSKYFARAFKISNFSTVPSDFFNNSVDLRYRVNMLKEKIAAKNPLVIGSKTFGSIEYVGVKSSGLWDSYSNEIIDGGHAMCVVGYDDNKFGGAFEVMNSWGDYWGDDGFLWIKYDDFLRKVDEVYFIETFYDEPFKVGNGTCYLGDCKNEYSFIKFNEKSFYEGEFRNGNYDGYGIFRGRDGIEYVGRWNYGKKDGQFLVYNSNKDISYKITYNNNIKVDEKVLGFANSDNENDLMNDDFFKHLENNGLIKLVDSDDFDGK